MEINSRDIENLIELLDGKCDSGVSRIKVEVSEQLEPESIREVHHHGRCDVGSVFATGMNNVSCD